MALEKITCAPLCKYRENKILTNSIITLFKRSDKTDDMLK